MSRMVTPGSMSSGDYGPSRSRPFFATDLVRRYGVTAVAAIVFAAVLAFAPLGLLYWFNELRLSSVATTAVGQPVVVKPAQSRDEQERVSPGDTALLQVTCDVPTFDGWEELLRLDDPARPESPFGGLRYVRRERVYLRRAGASSIPFGLLGPPPVSVWLPAGNYEILVVHEAPTGESRIDATSRAFPWVSVFAECSLEAREKTVCRVSLPHYDAGNPDVGFRTGDAAESADRSPTADEFASLIAACETVTPIPSPAGYVLALEEPRIIHHDGHRDCVQDFHELQAVPREWTREQLATLRNWLPAEAVAARASLTRLVDHLGWREFGEGWFCYAAAALTGLVFTRWGAIALVEPWRRRAAWNESWGLFFKIGGFSIAVWFVFQVLTN